MTAKPRTFDKVVWIDQGWQPTAIGFVPSKQAWRAEMRRQQRPSEPWPFAKKTSAGNCQWMVNDKTGALIILICVNETIIGNDPVHLIASLVHEASHALDWIFEHTGQEPCTETRAYSIENIVRGLLHAYSDTLGRGKNWNGRIRNTSC